jgi:hypothetical protein
MNEIVEGARRNRCIKCQRYQFPDASYVLVDHSDWNCGMYPDYRHELCGCQWHQQRRHRLQLEQLLQHHHHQRHYSHHQSHHYHHQSHHHHHHHQQHEHHQNQQQVHRQQQVHQQQHLMEYRQYQRHESRQEAVKDQDHYQDQLQYIQQLLQLRLQPLHFHYPQEYMSFEDHRLLQQVSDQSNRVRGFNENDYVQQLNPPGKYKGMHVGEEVDSYDPNKDRHAQNHQNYSESQHVTDDAALTQIELARIKKSLQSTDVKPTNRELLNEDLEGNQLNSLVQKLYKKGPATSIGQDDLDNLRFIISEPSKHIEITHDIQHAVFRAVFSPVEVIDKRGDINPSMVSPKFHVSLMNRFEVFKELANTVCRERKCDKLAKYIVEPDADRDQSTKHRFIRFIP